MGPRLVLAAVLASFVAGAAPARADEPDAATTLTAVQLAEEAGDLFQAGKIAEALDRYQRADALVHRHTIGVRIARCLERLGRLTEAAERYDAVARSPLPSGLEPDKLAKQKDAVAQAASEREALLPRIPAILVEVKGAPDAVVTLDGKPFPAALLGVKRAIDPGAHHIEARAGADVDPRDVVLKEAEVLRVSLDPHAQARTAPLPLPPPVPPPLPPPPPVLPPEAPGDSVGVRRAVGFAGIGVGAAGLLVGITAGALAVAKKSELTTNCGAMLQCTSTYSGDVGSYNTERIVSSAGLIAGGVVAAVGVVLVATARGPEAGKSAAVFVGPASLGVRGTF